MERRCDIGIVEIIRFRLRPICDNLHALRRTNSGHGRLPFRAIVLTDAGSDILSVVIVKLFADEFEPRMLKCLGGCDTYIGISSQTSLDEINALVTDLIPVLSLELDFF